MVGDATYGSAEALLSFTMKVAAMAADRQWYQGNGHGQCSTHRLDKVLCPPAYLLHVYTIPVPHWNPLDYPLSPFMFLLK